MQSQSEAVELYRKFAKFPQTTQATLSHVKCGDAYVINTLRTQRDLERAENIKFSKSYCVKALENGNPEVFFSTSPQEIANEVWNKESPSGKYRAIVRKVKDKKQEEKYYIEIWDGNHKIENIDALSTEKHGKIYDADGYFGCLEWSHSEDKLLYTAEKKYKKAVSYFTKVTEGEESKTIPGEEYVMREEWGEGLVGKHHPVLCTLTIATGEITLVDNVPEDVSPGQAVWSPEDEGIVFTGWHHEPFRLGLIYCPIRKSTIFHLDLKTGKCDALSTDDKSSRCPVFSPDNKLLVYLQCITGGPHMRCGELLVYDWANKTNRTVVQEVHLAKLGEFPGIFTVLLQRNCWSSDSQRVIFSSAWRSQTAALAVNVSTGNVMRLPLYKDCCMTVLNVKEDIVVSDCSSPCQPNSLVVGRLPAAGQEGSIVWSPLDTFQEDLDIEWKTNQHQPTQDRVNASYPDLDYESVLMYSSEKGKTGKLVVFPHGGPHSVFVSDYKMYPSLLCKLGYSTLMVNYRGSIGFGSDSINSLLGNIGDQDVKDVQNAALEIIEKEGFDKEKVVVWGGSHGGFLTCHLIGQYPGFYKAAVCRNPVTNVATMFGSTDIPDWNVTESGGNYRFDLLPDASLLSKMWKCSPQQYVDNITTPLMIMVGTDDKRCPPKNNYELYRALKARNKPVRYIAYPDNGHPIVKVDSEADAFINIYKWFTEHLPDS